LEFGHGLVAIPKHLAWAVLKRLIGGIFNADETAFQHGKTHWTGYNNRLGVSN